MVSPVGSDASTFGSGQSRYLITTSSTPHLRVIDIDITGIGLGNPPPWSEPRFYEIGLGATQIDMEFMDKPGFAITYGRKTELAFYNLLEAPAPASKTAKPEMKQNQTEAAEQVLNFVQQYIQ